MLFMKHVRGSSQKNALTIIKVILTFLSVYEPLFLLIKKYTPSAKYYAYNNMYPYLHTHFF